MNVWVDGTNGLLHSFYLYKWLYHLKELKIMNALPETADYDNHGGIRGCGIRGFIVQRPVQYGFSIDIFD